MTLTDTEYELHAKLLKVQALYAGTKHQGEKEAAYETIERIKKKLCEIEKEIETRISISEGWAQKLFYALCTQHNIKTYRYSGQRNNSIMIKATKSATEKLWLEYNRTYSSINLHLENETERLIKIMVGS